MKRLLVLLLCLTTSVGFALFSQTKNTQTNNKYASKAMSFVAKGDYKNAKTNFEAAQKFLDVQKVNKNSQEYIKVARQIAHANQCITFSQTAEDNLVYLTDSTLAQAFASCETEEQAEILKNSLLAKLELARNALTDIHKFFPSDKTATKNLEKCSELETKINKFPSDFAEIQDWRVANNVGTLDAYQRFYEKYPSGSYASSAKSEIRRIKDEEMWESAGRTQTLAAYRGYLSSFPDGIHKEEASNIIAQTIDIKDWREAEEANSTESYKLYMRVHPSGRFFSEAKSKLALREEDDFWKSQTLLNTVKAYNSYLAKYPEGRYVGTARANIKKVADKKDWDKAVSANTIEAYLAYLANSKSKAFKKEAEDKIAELKHAKEVEEDDRIWAGISNSTDYNVFKEYLASSGYKGHEKEAQAKYSILRARSIEISSENSQRVVDAYTNALKYTSLDEEDTRRLNLAKESLLYTKFHNTKSVASAQSYLFAYPEGLYSDEVSDYIAMSKADDLNMNSGDLDYNIALKYARTAQARKYVENRYNEAQRDLKKAQRKFRSEPMHLKFGIQGLYYYTAENQELDLGFFLGFGSYKNRFNLDVGVGLSGAVGNQNGSYYNDDDYDDNYEGSSYSDSEEDSHIYIYVSPKINLTKKRYVGNDPAGRRSGSDYRGCAFFIAPEFMYVPDLSRSTYGIRVGLGFGHMDLSVGYDNLQRISGGLSLFF